MLTNSYESVLEVQFYLVYYRGNPHILFFCKTQCLLIAWIQNIEVKLNATSTVGVGEANEVEVT